MTGSHRPWRALLVVALVTAVTVIGFVVLMVLLLGTPRWTQTAHVCDQPASVTYADGTYEVVVARVSDLDLEADEPYAVVGRAGNGGSYGVVVELNSSIDPAAVTCRWGQDAVEVIEPHGIVHTVPATVFMGGR